MLRDYVKNLRQRFTSYPHMARVMGVSHPTLVSWHQGKRKPGPESMRMLQLMGMIAIDAPELFDVLIGKERPLICKPIVILPPLGPVGPTVYERTEDEIQAERIERWNEAMRRQGK